MGVRSSGIRKIVRGRTVRWVIDFRFRDKDGREQRYRRDAAVQSSSAAHAEAERLKRLAAETGSLALRAPAPTFASFVESHFRATYMPTNCRPATRERYDDLFRQGVLDEFGAKRLDAISATDDRAYRAKLAARGIQARNHLSLVRTVLRAAFEVGAIDRVPDLPALPRQSKKLPDAPGDEEVCKLLEQSTGWLRLAILLAVRAGLRMGEIRALEVRDIDFERQRIIVRRALSADEVVAPKSGDDRVVPLDGELGLALREAVRSKLPHARLILTVSGRTPRRQHVLAALKRLEARCSVRAWSFHSLRHYFCTALVRNGVGIEAVRMLAGHSKLDVTQRYVHATGADLEGAIARLRGN